MARLFREDFDRERNFEATKGFTFAGKGYVTGQLLDKSSFTVRRLRQLYDQRFIRYSEKAAAPVMVAKPQVAPVARRRLQPAAAAPAPVARRRISA